MSDGGDGEGWRAARSLTAAAEGGLAWRARVARLMRRTSGWHDDRLMMDRSVGAQSMHAARGEVMVRRAVDLARLAPRRSATTIDD